ncbi:hypothetical protein B0H14DRAFT_3166032 [Mycena olivaceomarginata]|nr:hypothetical protein B0H14DRAFT_3166032 [Mycena olivaceomarginata]
MSSDPSIKVIGLREMMNCHVVDIKPRQTRLWSPFRRCPHRPSASESRLSSIISYLTEALTLINDLKDAIDPAFIQTISSTTLPLITALQNVRRNKDECIQLTENVHQILCAIVNLYIKSDSEAGGYVPPSMLANIGRFTETHQKTYRFVEAHQDRNKIKHLFRHSEMNALFKDCRAGLDEALAAFKIDASSSIFTNIEEMKEEAKRLHGELLELISQLSDGLISEKSSSVYQGSRYSSSYSFSMLPSEPKIFHGRETELEYILKALGQESPRIAILGGGGMGKTTLARAVLYHPDISTKFEHRLFVDADLETGWEQIHSRGGIEEFLSLLTDIQHLALMITMRGSERLNKVRWTRPFLPPLQPLSDIAARQLFFDIADEDLIAHLVDFEGSSNVLAHWEIEKTALFSVGNDRKSNLDASIGLSLSSPRITSGAKDLLSLLSILPDGLSDIELLQSNLPIRDIRGCKTILLATSLAYNDNKKRLRALLPIREHKCNGAQLVDVVDQITFNLANLQQVLHPGLNVNNPDITDIIRCSINLNSFCRITEGCVIALMDEIPSVFSQLHSHELEMHFLAEESLIAPSSMTFNLNISKAELENPSLPICVWLKLGSWQINLYQESSALWIEAEYKAQLGNYRDSATCLDRAKEILGVCGMSGGLADSNVEMSKATVHLLKSEYTEARNINLGVLGNTDHDPHVYARALINIAEIDVIIGATAQDVQQNMNEAKFIFSASQYRDGVTSCEVILADLELREGYTFSAQTLFRKCLSSTWGREVELTSFALERLADGSRWHSIEYTPQWSVIYLCHAHQSKEKLEIHKTLFFLGEVFASDQDQQTARNLFNVALEGFTLMDVHRSKVRCMLGLGDLENEAGNQSKAVEFWKAARPLSKRSSQANQIVQIDTRLAATRTIKPII